MIIPYQELSADTLQALLEDFATRDGTDYGAVEYSTAAKVAQLHQALQSGVVCICYDALTSSCVILPQEEAQRLF